MIATAAAVSKQTVYNRFGDKQALFSEIATLGEASARRIYGDFASPQIAGWTKVLARFAIQPQQNFANTKGKNSGHQEEVDQMAWMRQLLD